MEKMKIRWYSRNSRIVREKITLDIILSRYKFFWVDEMLATYSVITIPINTTLRRDKLPPGAVLFPILLYNRRG